MRRLELKAPKRVTSARGARARRRSQPRVDWRRGRRRVLLGLGLAALATFGWLWHSGWVERQVEASAAAAYRFSAGLGFTVDDVLVEGRFRSDRAALLAALGVKRGSPILALDPETAKTRLEALPWVGRASVERRLPHTLYLRLVERQPLALWQLDGKVSVIDQDGQVISGVPASSFADLPLLVGEGAAEHAAPLLALLEREPDLKPLVRAAIRVSGRRWNLQLVGGVDVRLPETDPAAAWVHFARLEREHGLLGRDVIAIDLRLPDRLVVRMAPGADFGDKPEAGRNT